MIKLNWLITLQIFEAVNAIYPKIRDQFKNCPKSQKTKYFEFLLEIFIVKCFWLLQKQSFAYVSETKQQAISVEYKIEMKLRQYEIHLQKTGGNGAVKKMLHFSGLPCNEGFFLQLKFVLFVVILPRLWAKGAIVLHSKYKYYFLNLHFFSSFTRYSFHTHTWSLFGNFFILFFSHFSAR